MCTMNVNICFIVFTFSIQMVHAGTLPPLCNRDGKQVCCSGYKRSDTTGLCDKCPPGYTGVECTFKCSNSYYGDECSSKCDCPQELCDFVSGCKYISTQVTHTAVSENNQKKAGSHIPTLGQVGYITSTRDSLKRTPDSGSRTSAAGNSALKSSAEALLRRMPVE
uniref:Multiple epidermal growth factor-like domains protein 6 isoform X2 n=1 Tax=Crassostrea virginica TaxID=6565 RepID=A0A8B8AVF0_CRAVI|nr:multiple epidermal growth factor-like domains protein 6 isoform X2 [Crassostrea virginica]